MLVFFVSCHGFVFGQEKNVSVITIEGADFTEYKKNKETNTEEIILTGNVTISVKKDSKTSRVSADTVTYNRSTQMMYAVGNVSLVQTDSGEGEQHITATTLLLNTSTLEGIFDNGRAVQTQSNAINLPADSTLIVASRIFGRDNSSTIVFKNAELTFCDDENPHWKIKASKIWLLPGGEFAFLNAFVSVGSIPLLYLPAFYYPKDELLFNPSFGYSDRTGYFVQTTTYLLGRKPLDTSSDDSDDDDIGKGIFNFIKPSKLKEQKREGLVYHNLEEDYKGSTSNYLKVLADYYGNMGLLTGLEGVWIPEDSAISEISGSARIAFSNTVFETNGKYTSYGPDGDVYKDKANFLGVETPFRYSANFSFKSSNPFGLSISIPVYSDPYFSDDFSERSEYLDWIGFLMAGSGSEEDDEEDTSSNVSSFDWNVSGNFTFNVPEFLDPYIETLSITSLSSSIAFNSRTRNDTDFMESNNLWRSFTPERSFFYPSQITPLKISAQISGTIFSYPPKERKIKAFETAVFPLELDVPDYIAEKKSDVDEKKNKDEKSDLPEKNDDILFDSLEILEIENSDASKVTALTPLSYSLKYSLAPQFISQLNYDSSVLSCPEDFEWKNLYSSYIQVKSPLTITSDLGFHNDFVSMTNDFLFEPVYQTHPNLDGYSEASAKSVKKTDYQARKLDLTNTNTVSFKPFVFNEILKDSTILWTTKLKLVKTEVEFLGDELDPKFKFASFDPGDEDCFTVHTLSATINAVEDDFSQTFVLSTDLNPQPEAYDAMLSFGFPHATLSFSGGIEEKKSEDVEFVWKPFQQSLSLKFFDDNLNFTESYNYDLEEKYSDSLKLALSYKNFQLAYTMLYTNGYDFDSESGWVQREEKEFLPYSASLAYASSGTTYRYWKNRIVFTPKLNTSISYDCIRPTNSFFRFVPEITFKVHEALDITFSAETQNDVIFRYFQDYVGYKDVLSGEKNVFKDLYNSFAFWGNGSFWDPDQTNRKSSGFKLKNMKISVKRNLHDWTLEGNVTFKPRAITDDNGKKSYDYHPYISFLVSWKPMPSMKTEIVDEYGEWELNP